MQLFVAGLLVRMQVVEATRHVTCVYGQNSVQTAQCGSRVAMPALNCFSATKSGERVCHKWHCSCFFTSCSTAPPTDSPEYISVKKHMHSYNLSPFFPFLCLSYTASLPLSLLSLLITLPAPRLLHATFSTYDWKKWWHYTSESFKEVGEKYSLNPNYMLCVLHSL